MKENKSVIIGMAAVPRRLNRLPHVVASVIDQCDLLHIHINGPADVPAFLLDHPKISVSRSKENLGDAVKFLIANRYSEGYFFSIDDDIIYPENYVDKMIETLSAHDGHAIACAFGLIFDSFLCVESFMHRTCTFGLGSEVPCERRVMLCGTGTFACELSVFRMTMANCPYPNMADVWTSCKAAREGISIVCVEQKKDWLLPILDENLGQAICNNNPFAVQRIAVKNNLETFKRIYRDIICHFNGIIPPSEGLLHPLVSIVIPTRGRPAALRRAIASIEKQDYPNIEVVVINDAGCDVGGIIQEFPSIHAIYINLQERGGVARARNAGLEKASGRFIMYLDDDDTYLVSAVSTLVTMKLLFPQSIACYAATNVLRLKYVNNAFHVAGPIEYHTASLSRERLLTDNPISNISLIHERAVIERIGGFDPIHALWRGLGLSL